MKHWVVRWVVMDDATIPPFEAFVDAPDSAAAHAISFVHLKAKTDDWPRYTFKSSIIDDSWSVTC